MSVLLSPLLLVNWKVGVTVIFVDDDDQQESGVRLAKSFWRSDQLSDETQPSMQSEGVVLINGLSAFEPQFGGRVKNS